MVVWGFALLLPDGTLGGQLSCFAGWFFLGQLLSRRPGIVRRLTRPLPAVIFGVLGLAFAIYGIDGPPQLEYRAEFVVFALMGILALIAGVAALPQGRLRGLRLIGRTSMIWYVVHVPAVLVWADAGLLPLAILGAVIAYRALGHTIAGPSVVMRSGLMTRTTTALQRNAVSAIEIRESLLQRRLGLRTIATMTAAGDGAYESPDMAADTAVDFANSASAGLLDPFLVDDRPEPDS